MTRRWPRCTVDGARRSVAPMRSPCPAIGNECLMGLRAAARRCNAQKQAHASVLISACRSSHTAGAGLGKGCNDSRQIPKAHRAGNNPLESGHRCREGTLQSHDATHLRLQKDTRRVAIGYRCLGDRRMLKGCGSQSQFAVYTSPCLQ